MNVAEVFAKPDGPVRLKGGRWWMSRDTTGPDDEGRITVLVADGEHVVRICGTRDALNGVAMGIIAQTESALAHSPLLAKDPPDDDDIVPVLLVDDDEVEPSEAELARYYQGAEPGYDPVDHQHNLDAGRPGQ